MPGISISFYIHLADGMTVCTFARRLKTPGGLTP